MRKIIHSFNKNLISFINLKKNPLADKKNAKLKNNYYLQKVIKNSEKIFAKISKTNILKNNLFNLLNSNLIILLNILLFSQLDRILNIINKI